MTNFLLRLSYDGTLFHGWQIQPGLRTLQGTLTEAVERVCGERAVIHGSGRTDAGVHALEQVASLELATRLEAAALGRALNAVLPPELRVLEARLASPGFHARRDARGKLYGYRILRSRICPPFLRHYSYHFPYPLEENAMAEAAGHFCGEHEFRQFASGPPPPSGTRRTLFYSALSRRVAAPDELWFELAGSGFLHHMVRRIGGFLLEIGLGLRRASDLPAWLEGRGAGAASRTLPARGLFLMRVFYGDELNSAYPLSVGIGLAPPGCDRRGLAPPARFGETQGESGKP